MKTYLKQYDYPGSGGTQVTVEVIFNTGAATDANGAVSPTSSVSVAFADQYIRTDDVPNTQADIARVVAANQAIAENYIDGLAIPEVEGWLIEGDFSEADALEAPDGLALVAETTKSIAVSWDASVDADAYIVQLSESPSFSGNYQQVKTEFTECGFLDVKYSTLYYVRVAAISYGTYGQSVYVTDTVTSVDEP